MPVIDVNFRVSAKQGRFITSTKPECLYTGGIRSGKTVALCLKRFMRARHPKAREVLCRLTLEDLKRTTLRTLLEGEGEFPPILPPGSYIHNKSERWIRIIGGGLIEYFGLNETAAADRTRMKVGGLGITGGGIDQVEECTEQQYTLLLSRMSAQVEGLSPQLDCTANPAPPSSWLVNRYGIVCLDPSSTPETERTMVVNTTPFDNEKNLSPEYMEIIAGMRGVQRSRLVLGLWVGSEHMVYDNWARTKDGRPWHVQERQAGWVKSAIGVDDGTTAPFVALLRMVDGDGRGHIVREVYQRGLSEEAKVEMIASQAELAESLGCPISRVLCDPSALSLKEALAEAGFPVVNADNTVMLGIDTLRGRLEPDTTGEPMETCDPTCVNTIREMESYERDKDDLKERPLKRHDHAPDAWRYLAMSEQNPARVVFDAMAMRNARRKCETSPDPIAGVLMHEFEDKELDIALAERKGELIAFVPGGQSTERWQVWSRLDGGNRPPQRAAYAVFAAVGDGSGAIPTVISVGDIAQRALVAEMSDDTMTPDRLARVMTMLSIWLGGSSAPLIGWSANGAGGALEGHFRALGCPGLWTPKGERLYGWRPTPGEESDAVGILRAALESGSYTERSDAFFADAASYVYQGKAVMPLRVVDNPALRMTWQDRVKSRTGLWLMMRHVPPPTFPAVGEPLFPLGRATQKTDAGLAYG